MSPRPGVAATRRTALAGALGGAVALSGCDAGPPAAEPSPTPSPAASPTSDDPDQALVDQVVAELDELIDLVSSVAGPRPVEALATNFEDLHRAHRAVLTDDDEQLGTHPPLTGSAAEIERLVRRREERARRRLVEWSVAADSGALARLLASMSAAIAQQLAAPTRGTR